MLHPIELPLNLILLTIGTFLTLTLGSFLLFNRSSRNRANLFLAGFIWVLATFIIPGFLFRFHWLDEMPHLIGLSHCTTFLIGPLAYFYVRACTQKGFKLRWIDGLHLIPFVLDVCYHLPFLVQSGAEKLAFYEQFVTDGKLVQPVWMLFAKTVQNVFYFMLALRLILQYKKHLPNATSNIDTAYHRWMIFFIAIVAFPIIFLAIYVWADYQRIYITIVLLAFLIFIIVLYLATLIKPELFHAFPHQMLLPDSSEEQKQKYESSKLQESKKEKYLQTLVSYMEREKPYQSPDLVLSDLSAKINIPSHYLSQIINEKLTINFLDFINRYRIKDAQEKLVNSAYSHYTILAIAYEAGFNAKSTFYTAFKKQTGMTPNQYRKQAKVMV